MEHLAASPESAGTTSACRSSTTAERIVACRIRAGETKWAAIAEEEFKPSNTRRINTSTSAATFISFRSPAAWRLQLRNQSTYVWFPQAIPPGLGLAFEFMTQHAPHSPALAVALDASCLLQLGQEDGHERMLMAGKRLYGHALQLQCREIAASPAHRIDGAIAAITVLQICRFFTSMDGDGTSWRRHAQGMASLMQAREPIKDDNGFMSLVLANFRLFHFWNGLIARKRIDVLRSLHPSLPSAMDSAALSSIAERVPGLLEECDTTCGAPLHISPGRVDHVMEKLKGIERELSAWAAQWTRNIRNPPYQLALATCIRFVDSTEIIFPFVLDFKTLSNALDQVTCSACLLAVRRAMLVLAPRAERDGQPPDSAKGRLAALVSISNCADSLCMSLPYLCKPENGEYGAVSAAGPLYLATSWWEGRVGSEDSGKPVEKLAWCRDVAAYIQSVGIRTL
ncbi:hypothetical protein LTR85_000558 [Meristemomyces frigidus]|nr:hypothetical protein LTR85_000558 [Meristemomyces frigidus]